MGDTREQAACAPMRGLFISIEGGDGVGKTTQADLLCSYLEGLGYAVCRVHEPGGTSLGERIRSVLLSPADESIDPLSELFLYEAARSQLVSDVIEPALEAGAIVVCDRFADSTLAYQGFGRRLDTDMVASLNAIASHGVEPDVTVMLTLEVEEALRRATSGGQDADRMEAAGLDFHRHVSEGFAKIARRNPKRVRVVDAHGTAAEVNGRIIVALEDFLAKAFD